MDLALIRILKPRVLPSVSQGIALYERELPKKSSSKDRAIIEKSVYSVIIAVLDKISADSPISVLSLKPLLLEAIVRIPASNELIIGVILESSRILSEYVKTLSGNYSEFLDVFNQYKNLIINSIQDEGFFSRSSVFDILQSPVEYQHAESQFALLPKEVEEGTNRVYTLFTKNRYWEQYQDLDSSSSYSPLSINRTAGRLGVERSLVDVLYKDAVVYKNSVYKLRPNISKPFRSKFDESQWEKFSSRRLDPLKTFRTTLDFSVENYYTAFLDSALDINSVTSDSKVEEYLDPVLVDRDDLVSTFGGEGKALFDAISELKSVADYVGSFEGSVIGSLEYISKFSEYMFAAVYGRNETGAFNIEGVDSTFGDFNYLFQSITSGEKVAGLNFLTGFIKLKSFIHSHSVNNAYSNALPTLSYNPIYEKYKNGLTDRYEAKTAGYSYKTPASIDLLLFSIESLFNKCLYAGDFIKACFSSLDNMGRLIGSEGLGNVEAQLKMLQKVFPPGADIRALGPNVRAPGLTGGVKLFLESYSALYSTFIYTKLPATSLETLGLALTSVSDKLDSVIYSIKKLGVSSFSYIPNIQFKHFQSENSKAVLYLRSLGFKPVEIEKLITATSLKDLIEFFAPLSDSSDLKSFFKGFELSQLIYELGGDAGIDAYLSFLYKTNGLEGLLNILDIAQKNKSKATKIQISKYPKLIGLLISLTYAVNPEELVNFSKILDNNNLSLLESISYLTQSGQTNIINSKEDIELLQPIIDQVIRGNYSSDLFLSPDLDYEQTNSSSAIALREWTKIIGDNLGNLASSDIIHLLYDRSIGLTPAELTSIIGGASPTTSLGQMLDGIKGGRLTSFIKYANITGLGVKLGSYKNSAQLSNFKIVDHTEYSLDILSLLDSLESVFDSLKSATYVFESSIDYSLESETNPLLEALIFSQNKTVSSLTNTLNSMSQGQNSPESIRDTAGSSQILESPGIGNSRLPNRIPVVNSVSPEQYEILFSKTQPPTLSGQNFSNSELTKNLINKFIKFSEQNKLINNVDIQSPQATPNNTSASELRGTGPKGYPLSDAYFWVPATEYETEFQGESLPTSPPMAYKVGELARKTEALDGTVKTNTLGVSYISSKDTTIAPSTAKSSEKILPTFDPVSSCRKFGGENCEEIYENVADRCVNALNKSLYPEEYSSVPGLSTTSVAVDRPLGSFKEYKPKDAFVPTSSYMSPPKFLELLKDNFDSFGDKGEPITSRVSAQQIKFTAGGGEVSEFNNTEFAILEGADNSTEVSSETKCAYLKSPFEYQLCMNMLKCKRFAPPLNGEYFLSFCPSATAGGRGK